jgi:hypothetical protein
MSCGLDAFPFVGVFLVCLWHTGFAFFSALLSSALAAYSAMRVSCCYLSTRENKDVRKKELRFYDPSTDKT